MKKLLAVVGVVAALGAGAFALSTVLPAGAQTDSGSSSSSDQAPPPGRGEKVRSVLDGLVADGTISQEQEDKILAALEAARPDHAGKVGPHGRGGPGAKLLGDAVDAAAKALGMSADDLKAELKAGKTVTDVAAEKGVGLDTVTQALTDAADAKLAQAVTDGKLTQQQADDLKGHLPDAIDRFEHTSPPKGPKGGRGHHGGP